MSIPSKSIPIKRLHKLLDCDFSTGNLTWKFRPDERACWNTKHAGNVAGWSENGYIAISIDGATFKAHRVVWTMYHNKWPTDEIDHKDGVRNNNCINNLRSATSAQNRCNRGAQKNNTLGLKGVTAYSTRHDGIHYVAKVNVNGVVHTNYGFSTREAAYACYCKMAVKYHKEFAKTT